MLVVLIDSSTTEKYQEEITHYFTRRDSSGFGEGFNNKVRVMKRRCYGILNLKHFFQRLFLYLAVTNYILKIKPLLQLVSNTNAARAFFNPDMLAKYE